MRIGELAAKTGVSVRALRYYEEQGLLASERSPSGQRHYADTAVDRVLWIQCLYAAGLSSKTLREFLPCTYTGVVTPDIIDRLTAERDRINAQMADLAITRDRLDAVIAAASGTVADDVCCVAQSA
ncbi:MerR family transcriptional regulator [Streptomyces sp. DSM 41524]|uniref:MerR family transcriptional regulator n=1 Tax=Streptomyces asiaticus subsp. ignotus TaxID=3098222 RepID=A0ABU7Q8T2_9ACTN|nr:MerR family transcriptional regulator [Streptomyces sp. DASNCL29]MEE4597794.1 MerR family transcriptional regulator [Streptomyces sp. DSM 41524]TMU94489.1 MerR family transcriptional regulator [Streptomyces sp. DASNCL29]